MLYKIKLFLISMACFFTINNLPAQNDTIRPKNTTNEWDDLRVERYVKQYNDSLRKINNKHTFGDLLNGGNNGGVYMGITNHFEMLNYALGGELKYYDSYYTPYYSGSLYLNYRHLFVPKLSSIPNSCVSFGGHFTFVGLEANMYYNSDKIYWYLTPKIGVDYGNLSIFYGYSFALNKSEYSSVYRHSVSLKYALFLSAFKYHKMRRKSLGY